jgi:trypsin
MKTFIFATLLAIAAANPISNNDPYKSFNFPYNFYRLPDNRIVGGIQTVIERFPYIGSLQRSGWHICGGNILSERVILTAAHCVVNSNPSSFTFRVGSSFHATGGDVIPVQSIVVHPSYNSATIDFDYAVLTLSASITFDEYRQPIALPEQSEKIDDNRCSITSGWGNTLNVNHTREQLRFVSKPIVNNQECSRLYGAINALVTDRMVCAGYEQGGKDAW